MVEHGFRLASSPPGPPTYVPAGDWNGKFQDEWLFNYVR